MTILYVLVFVLANYIYTLGYLLGHLPNKASLLILLFLSLGVLSLCFLPLLSLFKTLRLLSPIVLTMLWLRLLLPISAFTPLTFIYFFNVGLANVYCSRWFPSVFLCSALAPFFFLLLSLLSFYISPFLLYIGLGPNLTPFFFLLFLFVLLKYLPYFRDISLFFYKMP